MLRAPFFAGIPLALAFALTAAACVDVSGLTTADAGADGAMAAASDSGGANDGGADAAPGTPHLVSEDPSDGGVMDLLALDATRVFWFQGTTLRAAPKGGGDPLTIALTPNPTPLLVSDGDAVFFGSQGTCLDVSRVSGTNVGPALVDHYCNASRPALSQWGTTVFVVIGSPPQLAEVPKAGGSMTNVGEIDGYVDLHVHGAYAYMIEGGNVMQYPRPAGPPHVFATGEVVPDFLASDDDALYWLTGDGHVRRLAHTSSGAAVGDLVTGESGAVGLSVTGGYAYWSRPSDGTIRRVKTSGGTAQTLGTADGKPGRTAVDATQIYFTVPASHRVYALPIPPG